MFGRKKQIEPEQPKHELSEKELRYLAYLQSAYADRPDTSPYAHIRQSFHLPIDARKYSDSIITTNLGFKADAFHNGILEKINKNASPETEFMQNLGITEKTLIEGFANLFEQLYLAKLNYFYIKNCQILPVFKGDNIVYFCSIYAIGYNLPEQ